MSRLRFESAIRSIKFRSRRLIRSLPVRARRTEAALASTLSVLCYHRVADTSVDPWGIAVGPRDFKRDLEVLSRRGEILALHREVAGRSHRVPRRGRPRFALTFDDGYACNFFTALPILERHEAPATFFIATRFIGLPSFWWDNES